MLQNQERSQPGSLAAFTLQGTGKITLDLLVLRYMARRMRAHLLSLSDETALPSIVYAQERRSRTHRMVVYKRQETLRDKGLLFVGFISGVQEQVSLATIQELHRVDRLLVEELASNPGLLTYSSLELCKGRWYNLVLLRDDTAHAYFRQNSTHSYAAHQLATFYYAWIRLHNGVLPCGLPGFTGLSGPLEPVCDEIVLRSTRYFSFPEIGQKPIILEAVREDTREDGTRKGRHYIS
jgi:hypothetical protein